MYYKYIYLHFLKQVKNLTYGNNRNQNIDYLGGESYLLRSGHKETFQVKHLQPSR